jgi:hypothetical protein
LNGIEHGVIIQMNGFHFLFKYQVEIELILPFLRSYVGEEIKRHIDWVKAPDGEFWLDSGFLVKSKLKHIPYLRMSYEDFMKNMDHVLMCHLTVESFSSEILDV